MIEITILNENYVRKRGWIAEHGLSMWIRQRTGEEDAFVLFDTGASDVFAQNAKKFGVNLKKAKAIALSHGHFDHSGGLEFFPVENEWPQVIINPLARKEKYISNNGETPRKIRFAWEPESLPGLSEKLVCNTDAFEVLPAMQVLTNIPQSNDFESVPASMLWENEGCICHDEMQDEQFIVADTAEGLVVILGCSHRGVVNHIEYAKKRFPGKSVHTVIGGMHLEAADDAYLDRIIAYFAASGIKQIIPLHCTGERSIYRMQEKLGEQIVIKHTGDSVTIG